MRANGDTQKVMSNALEWAYEKAVSGSLPGTKDAHELAAEYLKRKGDLKDQVNALIRWQNSKSAASGFVTGLGGLVTLPVAIPANLASVLYIQLRMIAAIAIMGGHDVRDDRVKTLAFLCLCGNASTEIMKNIGVVIGKKFAEQGLKKLSGEIIKRIQQVGFRLLTKFGSKGVINLSKAIPLVGGITGAVFDGVTTNIVGNTARKIFVE